MLHLRVLYVNANPELRELPFKDGDLPSLQRMYWRANVPASRGIRRSSERRQSKILLFAVLDRMVLEITNSLQACSDDSQKGSEVNEPSFIPPGGSPSRP